MTPSPGWGILGTGLIAGIFVDDLRIDGHRIAAVGSRTAGSAQAFAAAQGIDRAHGGYEELVTDPEVDIVYVATPNSLHREHALLAIDAGKHVLVEKPFALDAAEAAEIVAAGRSAGVAVMEAMWTRFLPHMMRLREIAESTVLGDIRSVFADHGQLLPAAPTHRVNDPRLGGGALLDLGVYPLSFAVDFLGLPERVLAHAALGPTGVDRQTAVITVHAGGRQALSYAGLSARSPVRAAIVGTDARVEIDPWWYNSTGFTVLDPSDRVIERFRSETSGRGMQYQARELEHVVRAGRTESELLPLDESIGIMAVLDDVRAQIGVRFPTPA
ncbi:Gfo/Idh/MocA family protein [Microbacterium xylanilyticum]